MPDSTFDHTDTAPSLRGGGGLAAGVATHPMLWVLGLLAILHLPSLFNPFVGDDYVYLETAHDLTWADIPRVLGSGTMDEQASGVWWTPEGVLPFYRPVAILTFAIEFQVWGMNPLGYHLTNLVLHLLCVYLVWRLGLRLTGDARLSIAAAAIFGLHPVHSEAVLWISGRFDVLVCTWVLSSVLAYMRWQDRRRGGLGWAALAIACFVLGLGSKETALILPAVVVAGECLRWRGAKADYRFGRLAAVGVVLCGLAVSYLAIRFAIFGGLGNLPPPYGVDLHSPTAFWVILRTVGQYILDFVLFIHVEAFYMDGFWADHAWFLLGLVTVAGVVIVWGWRLAGGRRGFRVGVMWLALFTAPSLMAMPGERNVYLASAGLALAAGSVFSAAWERARFNRSRMRRVKRVAGVLTGICTVIAVADHVAMWAVADVSQRVYDGLLAELPDPPPDSRIYIVNQCPLNAVGFRQGVRLHYGRKDIVAFALTLAPHFPGVAEDIVYRTGPSSVKIIRRNGVFFHSFLERFALFSYPVSSLPVSARRSGMELVCPPDSLESITELELVLPGRLGDGQTHLFVWDNRGWRAPMDLIRRAKWPRLVRCQILEPPASVVRK